MAMNPDAPSLAEFLGDDDEPGSPAQSPDDMLSVMRQWAARTGTTVEE